MKTIVYRKKNGQWIANTESGLYLASSDKKADCTAQAIDYLLDAANYAFNTPYMAIADDGSIFCGKQSSSTQYTIFRNGGGSTIRSGCTGMLTRKIFDKWVSDYNQATRQPSQ